MQRDLRDIIAKCTKGDRQAQFELYGRYKVLLFGVCMRYASSRAEAEDMLQEGFYLIFRDLKSFSGNGSFEGWMKKVTVNAALMHMRKHRKLKADPTEEEKFDYLLEPDVTLWNSDRVMALIHMVRQLPLKQQLVFNMKAIDGYPYNEISKELDTSEGNCRSLFLRARKGMQEMLDKELKKDGRE